MCRSLDYKLSQRGERALIIGATSGDTGSAAIHACKSVKAVDLFMLHPKGRVSDVQRRQMTTVSAPNLHNFAVDGTFDDCQTAVKALLNDPDLNRVQHVTAVNSVNWTRVAAQVVYYFYAGLALGAPDRKIDFVVPTGNFGNICVGHVARKMGLSVGNLTIASNRNDILTRFFENSSMKTQLVQPSLTPSMDIQNSSNFERLLFELLDGNGANVAQLMQTFKETGEFSVSAEVMSKARDLFSAVRVSDDETKAEMARILSETSEIVDPHTAVGLAAARQSLSSADNAMVVLGTAHPAKFPDAVMAATGRVPDVPESLHILQGREEFESDIANDIDVLKGKILSTLQNS
ncbi:threonine synthase [Candidatus Halocynthiibacter alkanivorans]|uniref:threonine synthase n=1 Tax=Candidatus Halocynthiibacter alkanivorans TaxID=2267619 RepID=UPI00190FB12E|nr:threonine synthase [Candidatus Halocynthiibacter alkanivorans]